MVSIDISDGTAHNLFRDMLAQDYRRMARDIAEVGSQAEICDLDREDLDHWKRWHAAMTELLDYYFTEDEARGLRNDG